jgi:hypothetical protein
MNIPNKLHKKKKKQHKKSSHSYSNSIKPMSIVTSSQNDSDSD